jgi:hypothetical protein
MYHSRERKISMRLASINNEKRISTPLSTRERELHVAALMQCCDDEFASVHPHPLPS